MVRDFTIGTYDKAYIYIHQRLYIMTRNLTSANQISDPYACSNIYVITACRMFILKHNTVLANHANFPIRKMSQTQIFLKIIYLLNSFLTPLALGKLGKKNDKFLIENGNVCGRI